MRLFKLQNLLQARDSLNPVELKKWKKTMENLCKPYDVDFPLCNKTKLFLYRGTIGIIVRFIGRAYSIHVLGDEIEDKSVIQDEIVDWIEEEV